MIPPQRYIFFIIFLKVGSINTLVSSNDSIWILQNVLQMKSWQNDEYGGLPLREIFVNGQITTLRTILVGSPMVNEENIDKISSAIYMSLECKLSNNLMNLLKQATKSNVPLEEINDIVLKIISVFLDLIDVSPNVVSHEPGLLTTSLSINLHIKKTIHLITNLKVGNEDKQNNYFVDRKYWHMLNTIERSMILNCPLNDDFEYQMLLQTYSDVEPSELIKNINDSLENTGLKTTTILEIKTNSEQTHNNDNFITIIILVLKQLRTIMSIEKSIFDKINDIENDFSDILLYMNIIFDSIMKIMYEHTIETLESIRTISQHEKYSKTLKKLIKKWTNKGLINIYKQLILKSQLMQFPMYFTIHLKFLLRIINDMIYYKNVRNLKILHKQTKEYLIDVQNKYRQGLELLPSKNNSKNKDNLWKILEKIISINEFKNFNLIFKLQHNYEPVEYDSTELKLNKMKYITEENIKSEQLCTIIKSLYSNCFNIKIIVGKLRSDPKFKDELKTNFSSFLKVIKTICESVPLKFVNQNFRTIFLLLNRYFGDNTIDYTFSEIIFKKVIYFTMNLLDKYNIQSCETLVHRSEMYAAHYYENTGIIIPSFEHFEIEHTYEIKNPVQIFSCSENVEENQTFAKLQKISIDRFYTPNYGNPLFYWKGELKTFKFILDDVKTNYVLDYPLYTKYVNIFHKWIVSMLFYTMIDVLKYFSIEKHNRNDDKLFTAYVKNLQNINFPAYFLPIINTIIKAENFYQPVDIIEFQILLEDHVNQYSKIKKNDTRSNTMSVYMVQLENFFVKLLEKYDDVYISSEPITNTINSENFNKATQDENIESPKLKASDGIDKNNSNDSKLSESNSENFNKAKQDENIENTELKASDGIDKNSRNDSELSESDNKNKKDRNNSNPSIFKRLGSKSMSLINKIVKTNPSTKNPK